MNYTQTYLMANMHALPTDKVPFLQKELEELDEKDFNTLLMVDLKNPVTALILALFLGEFGADRFYIKQKELGIAKLILTLFGILTLIIFIGFFILAGMWVWKIVDCCLIMGACKESNYERLVYQLNLIKMQQRAQATGSPTSQAAVSKADLTPTETPEASVEVEEMELETPAPVSEMVGETSAIALAASSETPEASVEVEEIEMDNVLPAEEGAEELVVAPVEEAESDSEGAEEVVEDVAALETPTAMEEENTDSAAD